MILKRELENKIFSLEKKILKATQAISYLEKIIQKIKNSTQTEEIKQIFIRKEQEIYKIKILLKEYRNELNIYNKHKGIILSKLHSIKIALRLLDELHDRIIDLITTVQSMIIFIEYSDFI